MKVRSLKQRIRDNQYYQYLKQHRQKTKEDCENELLYSRLDIGWGKQQMRFKWIDKQCQQYIPEFSYSKKPFQVGVMEFSLYLYIGIEKDYLRNEELVAYININPQFRTKADHPYRKPLPDNLELKPEAIQEYAREVLKENFYLAGKWNRIQYENKCTKDKVAWHYKCEKKREKSYFPYDPYATSRVLHNRFKLWADDIELAVEAAREGIKREKSTEVRRARWEYPTGFDGGIDELHDEIMGMNRNTETLIHI
jgi:hypothetical protein